MSRLIPLDEAMLFNFGPGTAQWGSQGAIVTFALQGRPVIPGELWRISAIQVIMNGGVGLGGMDFAANVLDANGVPFFSASLPLTGGSSWTAVGTLYAPFLLYPGQSLQKLQVVKTGTGNATVIAPSGFVQVRGSRRD